MVNRSGFNVVSTNNNNVHACEHACSPNDGGKNQPNNNFSIPLMPLHCSITFNNNIYRFNVSLSQSFFHRNYLTNMQ